MRDAAARLDRTHGALHDCRRWLLALALTVLGGCNPTTDYLLDDVPDSGANNGVSVLGTAAASGRTSGSTSTGMPNQDDAGTAASVLGAATCGSRVCGTLPDGTSCGACGACTQCSTAGQCVALAEDASCGGDQ